MPQPFNPADLCCCLCITVLLLLLPRQVVRLLLESGADTSCKDAMGCTAMFEVGGWRG